MLSVRYSYNRMLLRALSAGLAALSCAYLYLHPEWAGIEWWTIVFSTGIGHSVIAPATAASFALLCWRASSIAFGSCMALEQDGANLVATTFWGTASFPVRSLIDVRLETKSAKRRVNHLLVLRFSKGESADIKTIRLPLSLTDLVKARYPVLVEELETLAGRAQGGSIASAEGDSAGFDPDAALARYMARRESPANEPAAVAPPAATLPAPALPARPSFGRKRA